MKYCKKLLSVLLSLVLCGSMVAPAFAVSFTELNNAINADFAEDTQKERPTGQKLEGGGYGYGTQNQETQKYEIEARDKDGARYVDVNTDIAYDASKDNEQNSFIYVGGGKDVILNLGDHTVTGAENHYVIEVAGGEDTDTDTDPNGQPSAPPGDLTIIGGTISHETPADDGDNSGESGSNPPEGNEPDSAGPKGGGILMGQNAHLALDGTQVEGNEATQGGGIYAAPGAEIELTNGAQVSGNKGGDVYLDYGSTDFYNPQGGPQGGAKLEAPNSVAWTDGSKEYRGEVTSSETGLNLTWTPSTSGSDSGEFDDPSGEVEIDDPDVPLAEGPITSAEFIYKLWLLDGEPAPLDDRGLPAAVSEDHEYADAIAWAVSADVVSAETFDPEELLSVDLARGFLTSFAAYADMVMPELTTLTGDGDDLVLNADDVLAEFFGRELDV